MPVDPFGAMPVEECGDCDSPTIIFVQTWDLDLPLTAASWSKEDLKDPNKLLEMTSLLTAQREMADKILDAQWEAQWRQKKFQELVDEKLKPYVQKVKDALPQIIAMPSPTPDNKKEIRKKWFF